jgi:hypothetical protein
LVSLVHLPSVVENRVSLVQMEWVSFVIVPLPHSLMELQLPYLVQIRVYLVQMQWVSSVTVPFPLSLVQLQLPLVGALRVSVEAASSVIAPLRVQRQRSLVALPLQVCLPSGTLIAPYLDPNPVSWQFSFFSLRVLGLVSFQVKAAFSGPLEQFS